MVTVISNAILLQDTRDRVLINPGHRPIQLVSTLQLRIISALVYTTDFAKYREAGKFAFSF